MITEITSTKNNTYKYLKALQQKKARAEHGVYTVEGIKSVQDAVRAGKTVRAAALAESFCLPAELAGIPVYRVPDRLFGSLCDTKTPQGILAVIAMDKPGAFCPAPGGIYIYCDHVADPGERRDDYPYRRRGGDEWGFVLGRQRRPVQSQNRTSQHGFVFSYPDPGGYRAGRALGNAAKRI